MFIVDYQDEEFWELVKGSNFNELWEGKEPNFAPFAFPQCIILRLVTYLYMQIMYFSNVSRTLKI